MDRTQKAESVEWIGGVFDKNAVVVVSNTGLTVAEMSELRGELRKAGASMKVIKNRLAKLAISGKPSEKLTDLFKGPTAIAFSEDPVAAAKAVDAYAKKNDKLVILGGAMGAEMLDVKGVKTLASMPSREELIATVALRLVGQASQVAQRITAPGSQLAGAIEVIREKAAA